MSNGFFPDTDESGRKLTSQEQRERMKEEFKRELTLRKQLAQDTQRLDQAAKLQAELDKLEQAAHKDDSEVWIERLNQTSALADAKLDMALEKNSSKGTETTADEILKQAQIDLGLQKLQGLTGKTLGEVTNADAPPPEAPAAQSDLTASKDPQAPTKTLGS